ERPRASLSPRSGLPRLRADCRAVVRAAERLPRPGAGRCDHRQRRRRVLRPPMIEPLLHLSDRDLQDTALALRSGRLAPPFSAVGLRQVVSPEAAPRVAGALQDLAAAG